MFLLSAIVDGSCKWLLILKLEENVEICSGQVFDIWPSFCVMWVEELGSLEELTINPTRG